MTQRPTCQGPGRADSAAITKYTLVLSLLMWGGISLCGYRWAQAHHGTETPMPTSVLAISPLRFGVSSGPLSSGLTLETRYLELVRDRLATEAGQGHLFATDLRGVAALRERFALGLRVPILVRFDSSETLSGVGDLVLDAQGIVARATDGGYWFGVSTEFGLPTGDDDRGLGVGAATTRIGSMCGLHLGPIWTAMDLGLSWSWRSETHVVADYGVTAALQLFDRIRPFFSVRGRTFLRTTRDPTSVLDVLRGQAREAGDTSAVLGSGLTLRVSESVYVGVDLQLPLGSARTFDFGSTLSLSWRLPSLRWPS